MIDDIKLLSGYKIIVKKNVGDRTAILGEVGFDEVPTKAQIVDVIERFHGDYADIKEIYSVAKIPFAGYELHEPVRESAPLVNMNDIKLDNTLFYTVVNPYYPDAIEYEGSINDPKHKGWYYLVAIVKLSVRNGLELKLWSMDKKLCDWANQYLNDNRC